MRYTSMMTSSRATGLGKNDAGRKHHAGLILTTALNDINTRWLEGNGPTVDCSWTLLC